MSSPSKGNRARRQTTDPELRQADTDAGTILAADADTLTFSVDLATSGRWTRGPDGTVRLGGAVARISASKIKELVVTDTIERVHVNDLTVEEFIQRYEKGSRPVIITGVTDTWRGTQEWQLKVSAHF